MAERITCPTCGGSGRYVISDDEIEDCPNCRGDGSIEPDPMARTEAGEQTPLYEMLVAPQLVAGMPIDRVIASADWYLPGNVFELIHGRDDVTVTAEHLDGDGRPVVLRWWAQERTSTAP